MITIGRDAKVKRFPYRSAMVVDRFFQIEFRSGDSISELRKELAIMCNSRPDNHECYLITNETGNLAIQFSDFMIYVGSSIVEENW